MGIRYCRGNGWKFEWKWLVGNGNSVSHLSIVCTVHSWQDLCDVDSKFSFKNNCKDFVRTFAQVAGQWEGLTSLKPSSGPDHWPVSDQLVLNEFTRHCDEAVGKGRMTRIVVVPQSIWSTLLLCAMTMRCGNGRSLFHSSSVGLSGKHWCLPVCTSSTDLRISIMYSERRPTVVVHG